MAVRLVRKKCQPKIVQGKALNGNMLLALSMEYAEIMSGNNTNCNGLSGGSTNLVLPGHKPGKPNYLPIFQAFIRVSEEETQRLFDETVANFEQDFNMLVTDEMMPVAQKVLTKTFNSL